jgi:site-specific DNA recombinase
MQTADLYIRVSTDEQADKGYSQRYQEEVLRRYCDFHKIAIRNVYIEDHSAKTFNRPKFKLLLLALQNKKAAHFFYLQNGIASAGTPAILMQCCEH